MGNEILDTKGKILETAIEIVGQKGEFTIRELTEKSRVNVAAINYYFGSKSHLLKAVENYYSSLLYTIQHEILSSAETGAIEKLTAWAREMMKFMFRQPAIIALIVNIINEDKSYKPLMIERIYLNEALKDVIEELIRAGTGITDQRALRHKYLQLFSGVLGPVISQIVSSNYGGDQGIFDISDEEDLNIYIDTLIKGVLFS